MTRAASDPETIREDIEATRQQLGDTIEALAERTDLRAQAKHKLDETKAYISKKKDDLLAKKEYPLMERPSPASVASAANQAARDGSRQTWSRSRRSAPLRSAGRSRGGRGAALRPQWVTSCHQSGSGRNGAAGKPVASVSYR